MGPGKGPGSPAAAAARAGTSGGRPGPAAGSSETRGGSRAPPAPAVSEIVHNVQCLEAIYFVL